MRTRLDELLSEIRKRPKDDELRLVYADALEEAGKTLPAEVIRRSIANDREWVDAVAKTHEEELAGPVIATHAREWMYQRGLVWWITTTFETLAEHGAAMLRAAPVERLTLQEGDHDDELGESTGEAIAEIVELTQIEAVDLFTGNFREELLAAFMGSPHLTALRTATFMYGEEREIARVFASSALPALRELVFWMESGTGGDEAARLLAESPLRRDLTRLEISGCEPTDAAVHAIASSPHLRSLEQLLFGSSHYSQARLTAGGIRSLATAANLGRLRSLHLPECGLDDASIAPLGQTRAFRLEALSVAENRLTDVRAILDAPCLASLRRLDVKGNLLDDAAVDAILAWPNASNLAYLDVGGNRLTDAAREALRTSPCLSNCEVVVG